MEQNGIDPAVLKDNLFIPLIDFSNFKNGTPDQVTSTASAILSGFQKAGFIYLRNHGISPSIVSHVFSQSARFFQRPQSEKDELAWYSAKANRGYVTQGREKVTQLQDKGDVEALKAAFPDLKESMEIGRDDEPEMPNMWPEKFDEEGKEFKRTMEDFFEQCKQLHIDVMRAIAVGIGLDRSYFDSFTDKGDNTLRLLHYPPVPSSAFEKEGTVRAGEHTDYGSITLLFQDDHGGLQVMSPNGNFVDATPIPDTIVVNAGDLLARWSSDTIKSTKHRVVQPPMPPNDDGTYPARYSVAYFCNPNFDRYIDAIPGTWEENTGVKKYEGVISGDYLVQRLTATY